HCRHDRHQRANQERVHSQTPSTGAICLIIVPVTGRRIRLGLPGSRRRLFPFPRQFAGGAMTRNSSGLVLGLALWAAVAPAGCHSPEVKAVPLSCWNRGEPEGIPFYLPKPILIIAKNFRNIEEAKVGLTDTAPIPNQFDDQAKYADLNARTSF